GLRSVLIAVGLVLPVLALALLSRFRSIDDHSEPLPEVLALLTRVPLLSPLPPTTLEKLAARSDTAENVAGDTIVAEGDPGELFYVIADGEVEVSRGGRSVGTLGPGDQFGEIALLRSTSRTATVVATGPTRLITIDGADFVDALSSSEVAFSIGWSMTDDLLGRDQTGQSS
ncbi:MAG: cyclic nucleotide-binding domain-containing protein, partial [Ilumatobacteraceae bacterium]